jgi:serine/threonine protein phosphatase PrpC
MLMRWKASVSRTMERPVVDEAPGSDCIVLHFAQITQVGGRHSNQDALCHVRQDALSCFIVSDGVGGQKGGEIAASIAIQAIREQFLQELSFGPRALRSYIDHATARIAQRKSEEPHLQHMSTTVAVALIDQKNRCALWAHIGDTRIYRFRADKIKNVTKDHSVVQQFIDAGYCTADELRTHPQRNTLFAALGQEGDTLPEVTQKIVDIQDGDAFLLCTDGLWEWLTDDEIEQALHTAQSADEWLLNMCNIADANGACATNATDRVRDNFTAFAIFANELESGR